MTLARLLVAVLVVCSAAAFAQQKTDSLAIPAQAADAGNFAKAAPSERLSLIPNQSAIASTRRNPMGSIRVDQYKADDYAMNKDGKIFLPYRILTGGGLADEDENNDTTCYKIRSYVVARDSQNSDSTHPVSYSTCQPAARYKVKTTEQRSGSEDR